MDIGEKFVELHRKKFNLFKEQNPENGRFDVIFEVEGKLLYVHRNMLTLESDNFNAMLSELWMKNRDEPIKIKNYSYDDFYQFITFLYSAQCELTDSNIYSMVDIAEFYDVNLFKDYCQNYLIKMEITTENLFKLMDLAEKFSINQLQTRVNDFIPSNFTAVIKSNEFLKVDKNVVKKLVVAHKYIPEPEDLFQAVYKFCENQAIDARTANPNLNLQDAIKTEISDFLPNILFRGMDSKFLHEYVVFRGFIFESWKEVSKILCDRDQFFEGKVISDKTVLRNIESLKFLDSTYIGDTTCLWQTRFKLPSTPSPLKKRDGIKWYLIYFGYGFVGVRPSEYYCEKDYLLAELTVGHTGFNKTDGCKIEIL